MSNTQGLPSCIVAISIALSLGSGCHSGDTDGDGGGGGSDASTSGTSMSGPSTSSSSSTMSSSSSNGSSSSGGAPGDPVALAEQRHGLLEVRVVGDRVVWAEQGMMEGDGAVLSCSVDGCLSDPTPIATSLPAPLSFVVDGTTAYWSDLVAGGGFACALDGSCATPPARIETSDRLWDIAVDTDGFYFSFGDDENGSIRKCPLTGCDASSADVLADGQNRPRTMVVSHGAIFWTNDGTPPELSDGQVLTCPTSGCVGAPTVVASGETRLRFITADATQVYWSLYGEGDGNGAIHACPRTGCVGAPTVIASSLDKPHELAVDDRGVYFTELGTPVATGGKVSSCPTTGCTGAPKIYDSGEGGPQGITTDATSIYWVEALDGRVMKATK